MSEPGYRPPLSYKDPNFLDRSEARSVRILSEYLQPLSVLRQQQIKDTVVFFGSARIHEHGPMARYYQDARELARLVTVWSDGLTDPACRFVVTTGGGPGIMEAANRGAMDAGGKTIGFNISLPFEQDPNPYISRELSFEFHYFFMRKFWFAYLAKALVVFPGGFGTLDELSEILTLAQTQKLNNKILVVLYGSEFWKKVINFEALAEMGMISPADLNLFEWADNPASALKIIQDKLTSWYLTPEVSLPKGEQKTPAIAATRA